MTVAFGITFSPMGRRDLTHVLVNEDVPAGEQARRIVTANLDHIVQMRRRADFRAAYDSAWAATIDGVPVHVYTRLRNANAPERVTGSDLFADLMPLLDPKRHRCVFLASTEETGDRLRNYLLGRGFEPKALRVLVPEFGFEKDPRSSERLVAAIRAHEPTHVFLGLSSPKSEIWTDKYSAEFGDCYVLHIGAALEFFVGMKKRAPVWMQKAGFEWLWRVGSEPRRLFARYFVHSWQFAAAVRDDLRLPRQSGSAG